MQLGLIQQLCGLMLAQWNRSSRSVGPWVIPPGNTQGEKKEADADKEMKEDKERDTGAREKRLIN